MHVDLSKSIYKNTYIHIHTYTYIYIHSARFARPAQEPALLKGKYKNKHKNNRVYIYEDLNKSIYAYTYVNIHIHTLNIHIARDSLGLCKNLLTIARVNTMIYVTIRMTYVHTCA